MTRPEPCRRKKALVGIDCTGITKNEYGHLGL